MVRAGMGKTMAELLVSIVALVLIWPGAQTAGGGGGCVTLMATAGAGKVDLAWSDSGADHYNVYRGTVMGGPYGNIGTTMATSFEDTNVVANTTYYYVVRPAAANGLEICQSNEAEATPTEATPTATPTNTPVAPGGACIDSADCVPNSTCVDGVCVVNPAPAPLLSSGGLLATMLLLLGIGGGAVLRRRHPRPLP